MTIIESINDPDLFKDFLGEDHSTWSNWFSAIKCLYGLPLNKKDRMIIRECTGRKKIKNFPSKGFREAHFITGRRSGKSRTSAIIGGFESVCAGHEKKLAMGEKGIVGIFSPTKDQSSIVYNYLRALFQIPLLQAEVVRETKSSFELRNGITVSVITGDHKIARGFTLICGIVDELAFFGVDENCRVKSDTELARGIKPGLATSKGKLICITSPWIKMGYVYKKWKKNFGNEKAKTLIWNCSSRTMNPTLDQAIVDEAMEEDPSGALSEYFGKFREDTIQFCPREFLESCVITGRFEMMPQSGIQYSAFFDTSGGVNDSACLGIAFKENDKAVLALLQEWKAPNNPFEVVSEASKILKLWKISSCTGDRYSAEFLTQAFRSNHIQYIHSERNKSQIYLEFLPLIATGKTEFLDGNEKMINQFASLIRTGKSSGREKIDHHSGNHDDLANVTAGAIVNAILPQGGRVGVISRHDNNNEDEFFDATNIRIIQNNVLD